MEGVRLLIVLKLAALAILTRGYTAQTPCDMNNGRCSDICVPYPDFQMPYDDLPTGYFCACPRGKAAFRGTLCLPRAHPCFDPRFCRGFEKCVPTGSREGYGYRCDCMEGYVPRGNGRGCRLLAEFDPCEGNGGCSDVCISNGISRTCSCRLGYKLDSDQNTCMDVQPPTITCPKVDPVMSTNREVYVSWVQPTVTDNSGKPVTVISNLSPGKFYWGRYKVVYDARDESGNRASCSFTLNVGPPKCPDLHTPINGAVSCDTSGFGKFCTLQCQNPYDFDLPAFMRSVPYYYVCGSSGTWSPTIQVPDCTRYQNPNGNLVRTLYYDYECPDPRARKQIKENAVSNFKRSPFGLVCNCDVTVKDFRVICGATNTSAVRGTPGQGSK
ncbi:multiple epidermal growth factor-like domains protein 6 isoform X2 [Lingula anatina]|uniref:Multiple epidermal growth factor-like domains protein 6 isoform X2 n=1 Tax=Lingula anatina TaxID=7574 RepID=A0A1S3IPF2_LINAN|nr:multiple epidermal growth factor-like domains protein 6 isoform X2 [Lingula anatina]|eukprot:XP_013400095.1 multiple epidermal growth factor-like domains protein 6 isoform X2 [Lingula anatina]